MSCRLASIGVAIGLLWAPALPTGGTAAAAAESPAPGTAGAEARRARAAGAADARPADSRCEGRNAETLARIWGRCEAGRFSGTNAETGNVVYGRCQAAGAFDGIDTTTAQKATGSCAPAPAARPAAGAGGRTGGTAPAERGPR